MVGENRGRLASCNHAHSTAVRMTFLVLIVVIAVAICCTALKWRRASRPLYVMSVILTLAVGCGPVPVWLLGDLQSAYAANPTIEWGKRNAIVLLGAGTEKVARF